MVVSGSGPGVDRVFFGLFSAMPNEKGHRVVPLLLRGTGYVPGRSSALPVILTGTGSKLASGELHDDEHGQHDKADHDAITIPAPVHQ